MIIKYRNTLQDYADRRKKLHKHDDGENITEKMAKGLIVVYFALLVLWLFLGAA